MRTLCFFLTLLFTQNGCAFGGKAHTPNPSPTASTAPTPTPPPTPANIQFRPAKNYTVKELTVLAVSETLANGVIQSPCFDRFMTQRKLIQTNGKTSAEVVAQLKSTTLSVPVVMYYKNNGVVGYRNVGNPTVYTNRKFHQGASACSRASNLTHEWSHVVGYGHTAKATTVRPRSVPYSINAAFRACCACQGITDCRVN